MDSSATAAVNPLGMCEIILLLAFFEICFYLALMQQH